MRQQKIININLCSSEQVGGGGESVCGLIIGADTGVKSEYCITVA